MIKVCIINSVRDVSYVTDKFFLSKRKMKIHLLLSKLLVKGTHVAKWCIYLVIKLFNLIPLSQMHFFLKFYYFTLLKGNPRDLILVVFRIIINLRKSKVCFYPSSAYRDIFNRIEEINEKKMNVIVHKRFCYEYLFSLRGDILSLYDSLL